MYKYFTFLILGFFAFISCDDTADDLPENPCEGIFWFRDADGDGFGNLEQMVEICVAPDGYVGNSDDCNDSDPTITSPRTWYQDADADGDGNPEVSQVACDQPDGYVLSNTDCNDNDDSVSFGSIYFRDADSDGFGDIETTRLSCTGIPSGFIDNSDDCDDSNPSVTIPRTWYRDVTGTGCGDPNVTVEACDKPEGYVATPGMNCDDDNDDDDNNTDPVEGEYFFPLTLNNSWDYTSTQLTLNAEGDYNGNSAFFEQDEATPDIGFMYKASNGDSYIGGNYATFFMPSTSLLEDDQDVFVFNETAALNESWSFVEDLPAVGGVSAQLSIAFEKVGFEASRTVNGNEYENVIEVEWNISTITAGISTSVETGKTYWAKDIGIVEFAYTTIGNPEVITTLAMATIN